MAMRSKIRDSTNKVRRYWPGKAPQWVDDHDTSFFDEDGDITILSRDVSFPTRDDDPRPSSLAEMRISNHDDDHRRHIRSAEIVDTTEEEEREEAMDERRRRIKERALRQREQEEEEDVYKTDDDELEDESDEEYFSEEEEEEDEHLVGEVVMVKPVFVSMSTRDTIVERQGLEKAEELALEARRRMEERKRETNMMLLEEIRKDKEGLMNQDSADDGDVDTDDDAEDKKAWEARERARVKKERAALKKKEEIERVKKMSNKERREYRERKYPLPAVPRPRKRKLKFMGAFFRPDSDDEDGILRRTGEDKMDNTRLPKANNFGRKGRTKSSNLLLMGTTRGWGMTVEGQGRHECTCSTTQRKQEIGLFFGGR